MSVREPANPHVRALHYRVARNDDVIYRSTQRSVHRRGDFDVVVDGGEVTLELHGHYVDEASARAAVRDYIEEWEFQADLTIGAGKLRLEFIRAEIVDRDPVFGDRHVPSWVTLASIRPSAIPAPVDYPNPPLGVTVDFDDKLFAAMRQRYDVYSRDPQTLTAVAYFCLTCLELGSRLTRFSGDGRWWVEGHARIMVLSIGHGHQLVAELGRPPFSGTQRTVLILAPD